MLELYPYQSAGAEWLASNPRACLADDMGLGKTVSTIAAAGLVGAKRVLVLAPTCVVWNWKSEFETWAPERATPAVVSAGRMAAKITANDTVIVTHGLLLNETVRAEILRHTWDVVVLDESHFFRSHTAKRTQSFYGVGPYGGPGTTGVVDAAERVWCLSGTPAPNNASELWTMLHGLWPEEFPERFVDFRDRYCETRWQPYGDNVKIVGNRNVADLRKRLAGKILRRKKDDVLKDLPPVRYQQVNLHATQRPQEIAALEGELGPTLRKLLDEATDPAEAFELLGSKKQFAAYRRLCGLAKADAAADLIEMELEGGLEKVVLFAHHGAVVARLEERLKRFGVSTITGATSATARRDAVADFQSNPSARVIVCNIVAGGTGTTLTASAHVVFVEMSYVPGENAQAADRIRRIGQKQSCLVRFVALEGTLDASLVGVLRRKTAMIREVME